MIEKKISRNILCYSECGMNVCLRFKNSVEGGILLSASHSFKFAISWYNIFAGKNLHNLYVFLVALKK